MSQFCVITGKRKLKGNHVSHANNKVGRVFNLNLSNKRVFSEKLGWVKLKLTAQGLKTIEKYGGLDMYLTKAKLVTKEMINLKKVFDSKSDIKIDPFNFNQ